MGPPLSRREFFPAWLPSNIGFFSAFRLKLKHYLFPDLQSTSLQNGTTPSVLLGLRPLHSNWNSTIICSGTAACQLLLQTLGLACLHNYMSHFKNNKSLSLYRCVYLHTDIDIDKERDVDIGVDTSCCFCFSGERWVNTSPFTHFPSPAPSWSNVLLPSTDCTYFSNATLGNPSESSLNFRSTAWNYNSSSRPGVFVPNSKKKINESKRGEENSMWCEALIDVEHLKALLGGSSFVQKLIVPVCFCTYELLLFI